MTTRLLSYSVRAGDAAERGFGLVTDDGAGVIDLGRRLPGVDDLTELIAADRIDDARRLAGQPSDHAIADIVFEPVVRRPGKIFCIGVNYGGRAAEYADRTDASYPSVFVRVPESLTGHDRPLMRPPESVELDYEGEIVAVIGAAGRRVAVDRALDHVAGLTLGNEGTIRDWVRHAKFNVTQGKNWESSGSIGPWLVPLDEIGPLDDLRLTTRVNGELRQDDTPSSMKYSIAYQIHYLSTFVTLQPGDLVFTGTPTGAGARFDPPVWLQPGDVVEVEASAIGTLRNTIADEFEAGTDGAAHRTPEPQ